MKKILFLILLPITINADWVDESNYTMNTILLDSSDKHYTQIKNYCCLLYTSDAADES